MALALCAFATTTVTMTSCSEKEEINSVVYRGTASLQAYDPYNELTTDQTKALQAAINAFPQFSYDGPSESDLKNKYADWARKADALIAEFVAKYPDVKKTKEAGVKLVINGMAGQNQGVVYFNTIQ